MSKKIFLKVYTEFNVGDDLFIKIISERYPEVEFGIEAPSCYVEKFSRYENVNIITIEKEGIIRRGWKFFLRKFKPSFYKDLVKKEVSLRYKNIGKQYDYFVSIGGSIFIQSLELPVYYDIEYYDYMSKQFKEKFIIGANFGPFITHDYKEKFRSIYKDFTDVCFRETYSYNLFKEISSVRSEPDVVFVLDITKLKEKQPKTVGFSIISPRNNVDPDKYVNKYIELMKFYLEKEYKVVLFSFCKEEGDESWINKIIKRGEFNDREVEKVFYNGDLDSFVNRYSQIELMYCGRFHSMILSMLFNQSIVPIAYSKKMINALQDMDFSGSVVSIEEFENIEVSQLNTVILENSYDISESKLFANKQFLRLDELLLKKI